MATPVASIAFQKPSIVFVWDYALTPLALICPSCQSAATGAVDLTPKSAAHLGRPVSNRGAFRDRHERETGCGGRERARWTKRA
jgi:hypothetical protein